MSFGTNIIENAKTHWQKVFKILNRATIFVDDAFAECLHWFGGAAALISAGAVDIKEFSSFESGNQDQRKAVFLVSQPLFDKTEHILRDILTASKFEYSVFISNLPSALHTVVKYGKVTDDEEQAIHYLQDMMLDAMGNRNFTADFIYIPLTCAPLTSQMFVTPGYEEFFPILPHQWQDIFVQVDMKIPNPTPADVEPIELPSDIQQKVKLLAYSVNGVLELLGVADDVYSLGDTSRLIATELANLTVAKPRRKNSHKKASIVFVDRTLDLAQVLGHHTDTLLDKMLSVNTQLQGHHNDIAVDMSPVSNQHQLCSSVSLPGCLAHNTDHVSRELFEAISAGKQKEALHELHIEMEETLSKTNLAVEGDKELPVLEYLCSSLSKFKGKGSLVRQYGPFLQLVVATVQTLKHHRLTEHASLLGIEKGLLQSLAKDSMTSPLSQIEKLLQEYNKSDNGARPHKLGDILGLLAYVYSLYSNPDCVNSEEEQKLKPLLVRALMETNEDELPEFILESVGKHKLGDVVTDVVSNIMRTLRSLPATRQNLNRFSDTYEEDTQFSQVHLSSILEQLCRVIFEPNKKQEVPDLEYKSTGFRDLLKSGFGLFMNVSKPRPNDHPLLIVFLVGGVSSSELMMIQQTAAQRGTSCRVLVGSTTLVKPTETLNRIFRRCEFDE